MRKSLIASALMFTTICSVNAADLNKMVDGTTLSIGESRDGIKVYRLGLRKDFDSKWAQTSVGYFSGYYELSINYFKGKTNHNKTNVGVALSPVFGYYFDFGKFKPYVEAGIGLSVFNHTWIDNRNLSTHFLFEDRIGIGARVGNFDFSFRFMHYSNASIKAPNDGIDIWIGSIAYKFWYNS